MFFRGLSLLLLSAALLLLILPDGGHAVPLPGQQMSTGTRGRPLTGRRGAGSGGGGRGPGYGGAGGAPVPAISGRGPVGGGSRDPLDIPPRYPRRPEAGGSRDPSGATPARQQPPPYKEWQRPAKPPPAYTQHDPNRDPGPGSPPDYEATQRTRASSSRNALNRTPPEGIPAPMYEEVEGSIEASRKLPAKKGW